MPLTPEQQIVALTESATGFWENLLGPQLDAQGNPNPKYAAGNPELIAAQTAAFKKYSGEFNNLINLYPDLVPSWYNDFMRFGTNNNIPITGQNVLSEPPPPPVVQAATPPPPVLQPPPPAPLVSPVSPDGGIKDEWATDWDAFYEDYDSGAFGDPGAGTSFFNEAGVRLDRSLPTDFNPSEPPSRSVIEPLIGSGVLAEDIVQGIESPPGDLFASTPLNLGGNANSTVQRLMQETLGGEVSAGNPLRNLASSQLLGVSGALRPGEISMQDLTGGANLPQFNYPGIEGDLNSITQQLLGGIITGTYPLPNRPELIDATARSLQTSGAISPDITQSLQGLVGNQQFGNFNQPLNLSTTLGGQAAATAQQPSFGTQQLQGVSSQLLGGGGTNINVPQLQNVFGAAQNLSNFQPNIQSVQATPAGIPSQVGGATGAAQGLLGQRVQTTPVGQSQFTQGLQNRLTGAFDQPGLTPEFQNFTRSTLNVGGLDPAVIDAQRRRFFEPSREALLGNIGNRGLLDSSERVTLERELERDFMDSLLMQDRQARENAAQLALAGSGLESGRFTGLLGQGAGLSAQDIARRQANQGLSLQQFGVNLQPQSLGIQALLGAGEQTGDIGRFNTLQNLQAQSLNQQAGLQGGGLQLRGLESGLGGFQAGTGLAADIGQRNISNELSRLGLGANLQGQLTGQNQALASLLGGLGGQQFTQAQSQFLDPRNLQLQGLNLGIGREQGQFGQALQGYDATIQPILDLISQSAGVAAGQQQLGLQRGGLAQGAFGLQQGILTDQRDFAQAMNMQSRNQLIDLIGQQLAKEGGLEQMDLQRRSQESITAAQLSQSNKALIGSGIGAGGVVLAAIL